MIALATMMALAVSTPNSTRAVGRGLTASVAACGVAASDISYRSDEGRQDTIVSIGRASLRKNVIRCFARTSWTFLVDFEFSSPRLQTEYEAARMATSDADAAVQRARRESRQALAQQGLLDGALRIRAEGGALSERARKIEVYCGFIPGSVIQVSGSRVWVRPTPDAHLTYAQIQRLFAVMDVVVPEHTAVVLVGKVAP